MPRTVDLKDGRRAHVDVIAERLCVDPWFVEQILTLLVEWGQSIEHPNMKGYTPNHVLMLYSVKQLTESLARMVWKEEFEADDEATQARRERQRPISKDVRKAVMDRDGNQCRECGTSDRLTIDHIVPRARGGSHDPDNLQTLCLRCNSRKGHRMPESA